MQIAIIINRPLQHKGRRIEAGQIVNMTPLEAAHCTATGRAGFVNPGDREAAIDAARAEDERITAEQKRNSRGSFWTRPRD